MSDLDVRDGPVLVVAAHPDDETIGVGSFLPDWGARVRVVHLTDGAPRNGNDARAAGFRCAAEYAQARREEAVNALALAGLRQEQILSFGYPDQELSSHFSDATERLSDLLRAVKPSAIFVHPYEGGHPDHDSASFITAAAVELCRLPRQWLFEYCSYHAGASGEMVAGEFLAAADTDVYTKRLHAPERALKRKMLDAYVTQKRVLANFNIEFERIRNAPKYDYSKPPHAGKLYYESFDWGMTGEEWRAASTAPLWKNGRR